MRKVWVGFCLSVVLNGMAFGGFEEGKVAAQLGNYTLALAEWMPLAEQGDAKAQFELGSIYHGDNYKFDSGMQKDYKKAVFWYMKAADQGYAPAQKNLGLMYVKGLGLPKDNVQAIDWFRKAAQQGNAAAQYHLGVMYDNGEGVIRNYQDAVSWYRKAAQQGHAMAINNLGVSYWDGTGVRKNKEIAYALLDVSSDLNPSVDNPAIKNRILLGNELNNLNGPAVPKALELAQNMNKPGNLLKALDDYEHPPQIETVKTDPAASKTGQAESVASTASSLSKTATFDQLIHGEYTIPEFIDKNSKLVKKGDSAAMLELGIYYDVLANPPQREKGMDLYRQAAKKGSYAAMSNLCDRPTLVPVKERIGHCRRAATEWKSEVAQRQMALLYFQKSIPTRNDEEKMRYVAMWGSAAYHNGDQKIKELMEGLKQVAPDIVARAEIEAAPYYK